MGDYTETLEKQNEELKERLAELESLEAWRNKRRIRKLRFEYGCTLDNDTLDIQNISLSVRQMSFILRKKHEYPNCFLAIQPFNLMDLSGFKWITFYIRAYNKWSLVDTKILYEYIMEKPK